MSWNPYENYENLSPAASFSLLLLAGGLGVIILGLVRMAL